MTSLNEIRKIEEQLLKQLELTLTNLSAIRKTKLLLEDGILNEALDNNKNITKSSKQVLKKINKNPVKSLLKQKKPPIFSKDQIQSIVNELANFFKNNNKEASVKELKEYLDSIKFNIPVSNPGATIAAILRGNKNFFLVDKEKRLWALSKK